MEADSDRVDDGTITALRVRYNQIKTTEEQKDLLIEELFARYEYLSQIRKQDTETHEEDLRCLQKAEDREKGLRAHVAELQRLLFSNDFLREGQSGGTQAATELHDRVLKHAQSVFNDLPSECKVLTRLYGSISSLERWLLRNRIVPSISRFHEFCQGFTRRNNLFDMIDTGSGWYGADDRIDELLQLHLHNTHCRGIFFGGPRTAGYVQMLESIAEGNMEDRVTLLEAPLERTWAGVPFEAIQLGDLFRTSTISNVSTPFISREASMCRTPPEQPIAKESSESEQSKSSVALRQFTPSGSQLSEIQVTGPAKPFAQDQQTAVLQTVSQTWAGPVQKLANLPQTPGPETRLDPNYIPRNRQGQRIDSELPPYDKDEAARVRKLKLCNVHFLRNDCPFGAKCTQTHNYSPTKAEMQTLKEDQRNIQKQE
ncbi:MAG: hypothetical protein Q9165_000799 [Trypethelium subeluteriae]